MTTTTQQTPSSDNEGIRAVLETVNKALHDKDAGAVVAQFDPSAIIFDLAPPLSHRVDQQGWQDWFDTWEGPVERISRDLKFTLISAALGASLDLAAALRRCLRVGARAWIF